MTAEGSKESCQPLASCSLSSQFPSQKSTVITLAGRREPECWEVRVGHSGPVLPTKPDFQHMSLVSVLMPHVQAQIVP